MANSLSVDISAKITGYQDSLAKMKQAMQQLDPGAKISKSIQAAYKNAEDYVKKIAKNPIVTVKNNQQLQNVNSSLERATELIGLVNKQIQTAPTDAFRFEGIEQSKKQISELQTKLEELQKGPSLSAIANGSEAITNAFKEMGVKIDNLSAAQGLEKLNKQLKTTQAQAQQAKAALDQAQAAVANWKPSRDDGTLFSSKAGGKGTKLLKELQNPANIFKNIDFTNGFDQSAIQKMRDKLFDTIKAKFGEGKVNEVGKAIRESLNKAFSEGLTPDNIQGKVEVLVREIKSALELKGQTISSVFNTMFGAGMGASKASAAITDQLKKMSGDDFGAQRLRQIIDDLSNMKKITNQGELIKLVDAGQLEDVRKKLVEVLNAEKQLHKSPPSNMTQALTQAQQKYQEITQSIQQLQAAQAGITTNQDYAANIQVIEQLQLQLEQLKESFKAAQQESEKLSKDAAGGASQQASDYEFLNAELQKYQQQLAQIQAREKFIGKLEGVVQRWFSVYAVVRMVSNAIKSMISTVKELDKTITNIAIVTDMSQGDLWGQMPQYTQMARDYAASISGVYEVSQLYYQQGGLIFNFFPKICYNIAGK